MLCMSGVCHFLGFGHTASFVRVGRLFHGLMMIEFRKMGILSAPPATNQVGAEFSCP